MFFLNEKYNRQRGIMFFFAFFFMAVSLKAGEFNLRINDVSGVDSPWPIIAGMPFPEGAIEDSSSIRIMSGSSEIPAQVDVTATWRDGSIRWALAGFTASPGGKYRVEYGTGVRREPYPHPLLIKGEPGGGFTVDTGAAVYRFEGDKLLPEDAWLISGNRRTQILRGAGNGAYLVDNLGRMARVSGAAAGIESEVLKEGPARFAVKRSGWYVTREGNKLAKAEIWLYFAQGSPSMKVTHTILFTEDTNRVWFKDYGLEFRTPYGPENVYCAKGNPGQEDTRKVAAEGKEIFLLQDVYPHFAEREYRAVIGSSSNGKDEVIEEFKTAGDWACGDYGSYTVTLVMPWLSERFPKEISFGRRGARGVFWSGRSGRELDFRGETLVNEYWQSWAEKARGTPGAEKLSAWPSNAQGAARTHDIWLLPRAGAYEEAAVKKSAVASARTPLAMADPEWLCKTGAMGFPMHHKDTQRFPEEEAVISEYWQRFIIPLKAFPFKGFISWGHFSLWYYDSVDGRIMGRFHVLSSSDPYGLRREPWLLYARSGERTYYEHAYMFSRFTGDWYMAHIDVPGKPGKEIGGLTYPSSAGRNLPFFWGDRTMDIRYLSLDCIDWLFEYYLTGDENARDLVKTVKEAFKARWHRSSRNYIKPLRTLIALSIMDWDEEINRMARELTHALIDMESQNALRDFGGYGPMYKDSRNARSFLEYYTETGDELAKEAFLKLMDQRYRFDRLYNQIGYKGYLGFVHEGAYRITGDERYRNIAEQTLRDALLHVGSHPLSSQLKGLPENPLQWEEMPYGVNLTMAQSFNPFMGLPVVLAMIAREGRSETVFPVAVKPMKAPQAGILFLHENGRDTRLSITLKTSKKDFSVPVVPYPASRKASPVSGIETVVEEMMPPGQYFLDKPEAYPRFYRTHHLSVKVPGETESGLYLMSFGKDDTFTLLDSTAAKAALYCPEGFWSVSVGEHSGSSPYGRLGEGMPLFFRVPEGLEKLSIFLGFSARIRREDGSTALEMSDENTGYISIPVEGREGIWSIEPFTLTFKGVCPPAFYRLLNIEPVVAFGSPSLLPETASKKNFTPVSPPVPPETQAPFSSGISGKAVRLSGEKTLTFPRGERLPRGGYSFFPLKTGTVEFWFRADRFTGEIPLLSNRESGLSFLRAPHIVLSHLYRRIGAGRQIYSVLQATFLQQQGLPSTGLNWGHYFAGGKWTHVAYTWDMAGENGERENSFAVFVDGEKKFSKSVPYGLKKPGDKQELQLSDKGDEIVLGPFDGSMDTLRISDSVRYAENFTPSKENPEVDENTRALFLFDGNLKGISAFSEEPAEAR